MTGHFLSGTGYQLSLSPPPPKSESVCVAPSFVFPVIRGDPSWFSRAASVYHCVVKMPCTILKCFPSTSNAVLKSLSFNSMGRTLTLHQALFITAFAVTHPLLSKSPESMSGSRTEICKSQTGHSDARWSLGNPDITP